MIYHSVILSFESQLGLIMYVELDLEEEEEKIKYYKIAWIHVSPPLADNLFMDKRISKKTRDLG